MIACHLKHQRHCQTLTRTSYRTYAARSYSSSANRQAGHPTPLAVLSLTSFFASAVAASFSPSNYFLPFFYSSLVLSGSIGGTTAAVSNTAPSVITATNFGTKSPPPVSAVAGDLLFI